MAVSLLTNPIPTGAYVNGAYPAYAYSTANSYFYYPEADSGNEAIVGVDLTTVTTDAAETFLYRPAESAGTQVATDFLRGKFYVTNGDSTVTTFSDFNLGCWDPGQWVNYTRIFPTNTYNVYGRLASGGAYSGLSLSLVTNGVGTSNQLTRLLGTFSDPNANGWQAWDWVPLLNTNGQKAVVSLGGVETLQANNTTSVRRQCQLLYVCASRRCPASGASERLKNWKHHFDPVPNSKWIQLYGALQWQLEPGQLANVDHH